MEAAEMEAVLLKHLTPIRDRLIKLEAERTTAQNGKSSSESSLTSAEAAQSDHGLCGDEACGACVSKAQELFNVGFEQGGIVALENLDQWLIHAGGEDLRQKVILMAARGKEAYEASQQTVSIVA